VPGADAAHTCAEQTATRVKRKRETSVASDEGSAGSLTPTPSKNFKAVFREQHLPSTAEVSFSESLDLSLSDGEEDAARGAGGAAASAPSAGRAAAHRPPSQLSRDSSRGQIRTATAAFTAAGLLRTPGKGKGVAESPIPWRTPLQQGQGRAARENDKGKERARGDGGGDWQRCDACCSGVAVVLQWCCGCVAVVLRLCCSGVGVLWQWCCSGVAVVLQWCCSWGVSVLAMGFRACVSAEVCCRCRRSACSQRC